MHKRTIIKLIGWLIICLSGFIFLFSQIKLDKRRDRSVIPCAITPDLKTSIERICKYSDSPEKIIKDCSGLACKELSFTAKNNIQCGKANCVGYAQLTSTIINYAFQVKKLPYKAKPVVGKVHLFGIDLNNVAQKILPKKHRSFFKDHDFVEVDLGNKTVFIDSSLQDLTGLTFMQINNTKKP